MYVKFLKVFFVMQIISSVAVASYVKMYHTGSSKEAQTNVLSGSYSPSLSDEFLKISPWEVNASAGRSTTGSGVTKVSTSSYDFGASYHSENGFGISGSLGNDSTDDKGVTSSKPSVTLEKKWTLDGSEVRENENDSEDVDNFSPKIGISIVGAQKNSNQKGKAATKEYSINQQTIDYGISIEPLSWLSIDASTTQFSYNESVENAYTLVSSAVFTTALGYSLQDLVESFNDKEYALRLTFRLTQDTSIELSSVTSHSIALKNWSNDYSLEFTSSLFESFGYTIGVSQTKLSDGTAATYAGDASLSYYF